MAKQVKQYLVTFAKGTPQQVTLPIEATSKQKAAEEFSKLYIGRADQTLTQIVDVKRVETEEE